jgi:predicted TIM-barrel fold metal-dependent hydrolase
MIIDIHGHYTTEPQALLQFRDKQLAGLADAMRRPTTTDLGITDDMLRKSVEPQMEMQKERGSDLTIFSPRAAGMAHHVGTEAVSHEWTRMSNDLIHRVCTLLRDSFAPVGQLPQFAGAPPANSIPELRRIVELGFVGVNLNPDPTGGYRRDPPLTDRHWYPLYELLCELNVPAMIHVSSSCNPNFHYADAHYINGDTTAFMQLIQGDLFKDFPTLRLRNSASLVGSFRMTNGRATPWSAAGEGTIADDGVFHPSGRQIVFDDLAERFENLEAVPPLGCGPERDDGFFWGTTWKATFHLGDQDGVTGGERETLARPCLNPLNGIDIGPTTVQFH